MTIPLSQSSSLHAQMGGAAVAEAASVAPLAVALEALTEIQNSVAQAAGTLRHFPGAIQYKEMTRRLKSKDHEVLEASLKALPDKTEAISKILGQLKEQSPLEVLKDEKAILYAIEAMRRGLLTRLELASLLTFQTLIDEHREMLELLKKYERLDPDSPGTAGAIFDDIQAKFSADAEGKRLAHVKTQMILSNLSKPVRPLEAMCLFHPDGSINPEARKYIKDSLGIKVQKEVSIQESETGNVGYLLTEQQIDDFFEQASLLPHQEQYLLIGMDLHSTFMDVDSTWDHFSQLHTRQTFDMSLSEALLRINFNVFSRFDTVDGLPSRMHASMGLMQTYLNVQYRERAVKINPVWGNSSIEDIMQNGLHGTRDFAVACPVLERGALPRSADHYLSEGTEFSYHDFYHAAVASAIPDRHRQLFVKIAQTIQAHKADYFNQTREKSKKSDIALKKAIMSAVIALVDMEHGLYKSEFHDREGGRLEPHPFQEALAFWRSLSECILNAKRHPFKPHPQMSLIESMASTIVSKVVFDKELIDAIPELLIDAQSREASAVRSKFWLQEDVENHQITSKQAERAYKEIRRGIDHDISLHIAQVLQKPSDL